ncbi:uncharacterized protein SCHCODRAFT_0235741 [Schizophyllum commune H4-8]|uniref:Uncharacterized protein n=1 Tax=Schizophyllum commune (strain H4-8 / FGSC 9210) TaxID=578458 RepID=D8Q8F3_SCHCM|nr:uncharacterized protein SCHCODRAFT_0235741 [Schizophyllum commune H4-8]KAI5890837.1 hypothetical protein SCHCODRAFT_0235741 [Schizophyllum commune H4-8]
MVDLFALIQQGMRERWAWWKYVSLLIKYGCLPWDKDERDAVMEQLGALALLPADKTYLGAWFNTADKVEGRWMMLIARVPAYFLTDLPENGQSEAEKYASFGPRKIPGAKTSKWRVTKEVPCETPELPYANRVARVRVRPGSLGLTGWRKLDYPAAKDTVGHRHGVVCPPQLRNVADQGHWDYFVEWYSEKSEVPGDKNEPNCGYSKPVWLQVGKGSRRRQDAEGCKIIYERTMKRQYYVDAYPIIEGMEHDINVWGVPLPPWEHYGGDNLEIVLKRGVWGYTTEKPTSNSCGITPPGKLPGTSPATALCGRQPRGLAERVIAPHAHTSRTLRPRRG